MYCILSVQHTGTRSLQHLLNHCKVEHTYPGNTKRIGKLLTAGRQVVVPLRHPARVYESWKRRERRIHELDAQYSMMMGLTEKINVKYVDIEKESVQVGNNQHTCDLEIKRCHYTVVPHEVMDWYVQALACAVTIDDLRG